jgi:hypothetical protein
MDERDVLAERFDAERGRLRAVAYRMLGSLTDAEDAVQEAWLRLARSDESAIETLGTWLSWPPCWSPAAGCRSRSRSYATRPTPTPTCRQRAACCPARGHSWPVRHWRSGSTSSSGNALRPYRYTRSRRADPS